MTTMRISLLVSLFFAASTTGVAGLGARSALAVPQPKGREQWVDEHHPPPRPVDYAAVTIPMIMFGDIRKYEKSTWIMEMDYRRQRISPTKGTIDFPTIPGSPPIDDPKTFPITIDHPKTFPIRDKGGRHLENSVNQQPHQICQLPILRSNPSEEAFSAVDYRRLFNNLEEGNDFAADDLRTMYLAYLNEDEANAAIASIDTNGDGVIDESELANLELTEDFTEFLFNDMLACTVGGNDECVSYQVIIDFLNLFFGKTIVDEDLAAHIQSSSGDDACFTRNELQNFQSLKDNSGAASHMRFSVVLALACLLALLMLFM